MSKELTAIAKITSKGQTTIPAEVRAALGVGPGDRVEFTRQPDGQYTLRKARHGLEALRGIIKTDRSYTNDEIVEMVHSARDYVGKLRAGN